MHTKNKIDEGTISIEKNQTCDLYQPAVKNFLQW